MDAHDNWRWDSRLVRHLVMYTKIYVHLGYNILYYRKIAPLGHHWIHLFKSKQVAGQARICMYTRATSNTTIYPSSYTNYPSNTHYIYYSTSLLPFNVLQTIDPGWHLNPRPDPSDTVILFHREGNNSQRAWIIQRHPFHALVWCIWMTRMPCWY